MIGRWVRLANASAFILGFALLAVGTVLALTASWSVGRTLLSAGAVFMGISGLVAWKYKLPAP